MPVDPIRLRLIRVELGTQTEVLMTHLLDEQAYPVEDVAALYHQRWLIEEQYKRQKQWLQIENFSGKSVEAIRQDFFAKHVAHNLTSLLAMGAQAQVDEQHVGRKHSYKVNFAQALSSMKNQIIHVLREVAILSRVLALQNKAHRWFVDPRLTYDPKPTRRRMEPVLPWEQGRVLVSLWPRPDRYTPEPPPPRIITADLDLHCPVDGTANLKFGWLCGGDGGQIIIPIPASKVAISYDADAWAWGWSATLLGKAALDAVLPSAQGEPVTLAVNINGHLWHLVVEELSESREFGKRGVSVKGRGLSSFLASPYILPSSGLTTADRTLQQLMGDHLPIGSGASLTWTLGMADWLVPAGAWSWSNQAPINAIHAAAQEVGMVLVPGMADKVLHIQPRYPVMPWDFSSATPNLVVPDTAIISANRRQSVPTQANAVYVHGGEVGGVLAQVKRLYSAGDRVAATASSNLITHADAARHLGSRLLAAQHQQPALRDITMPLGGAFGLGAVGQLIAATLDNTEHRGIINAVAIDASLSDKSVSVRQTLTIGEDTPNTWSRFKRLLPYDPLLLGTVEQNHPDGTSTVLMLGGGSTRVRGTATVGQAVWRHGRKRSTSAGPAGH